jgi:arabinofuranan 3-O-arabinosyltransferase
MHETSIENPGRASGAPGVDVPRPARWHLAVLAVISYVPLLLTHPGFIAADTKAYLYLDPERLTRTARYLWNPNVGMGTVTHQNIGYLFPMGPWYWLFHELAVPTWIAQRLWMGTLLFAAGAGVRYLARLLGITEWGQLTAALIYMLTPYILDYLARTSAILMPWAGLGWLVGFLIVAVRRGGWRYPALFALVVALIGGVNATSVLLVGLAPALWVILAGIMREARWRDVVTATLRAGVLSVLVSLWWVAGLWAEGSYGINVLKYTETFPTVTMTSMSSEILRGLGYWYFYGNDAIQPWTLSSTGYMQHVLGILVSFAVPGLALAGAAVVRWRHLLFAIALVVVGVVLAVGAYPLSSPSPLGTVLRSLGEDSTVGLAMRSSNRVVPLVVLGLSLLAGSAIAAIATWRPTLAWAVAITVGVLACVNLAPLFEGSMVATNLMFPETLPRYVTTAANYLNRTGTTPVLGLPGEDFGYYRWGVTMDSAWPGLLDRPYIARQSVLQGEPASADLLRALDESIQDGVFVPSTLAPIARLMGVGAVLLQSNLQYERFDLPRPQALWLELRPTPTGLHYVRGFGPRKLAPTLVGTILDETQLMIPPNSSYPPDLAVFTVAHPRALLRTESIQDPIVLDGDGSGILLAAQDGLLNGPARAIVYAGSVDRTVLSHLVNEPGVTFVLTDTNAKELDTWGTLHTTYGYVEQIGSHPLAYDPSEQELAIFPHENSTEQTVLLLRGVRSVGASGYGATPIANAPEDQPLAAIDGNPMTAWEVGAFGDPRGQFLKVTFDHRTAISKVRLQQPQIGVRKRWATSVTLHFSSGPPVSLKLGLASRTGGQTFHFASHDTRSLTITITGMTGSQSNFSGQNGVGFAEVSIPGVGPVTSSLRLPTDLLSRLGPKGQGDPLVILLHRLRAATVPPRTDPELEMSRTFLLPWQRTFSVSGSASVSTLVDDTALDSLLGRRKGTHTPHGELRVVSTADTTRLIGSLTNSSWAAFDDNPNTSWMPAFSAKGSQGFSATLSGSLTLRNFELHVVVDGRHSVPTSIRVATNTGRSETATLSYRTSTDPRGVPQGTVVDVDVHIPSITGRTFSFTFPTERTLQTIDHIAAGPIALPIGIADVELPGVAPAATPTNLPGACLSGLLHVDGTDVPIRITGTTADALAQQELTFTSCAGNLTLSGGTHVVTTTPGFASGWNIDDVALTSTPGGSSSKSAQIVPTAKVTDVHWINPVSMRAKVGAQSHPSWLVLNQSYSTGWQADLDGTSLGAPTLLDGGFTAWRLPASTHGGTILISWTPQQTVDDALLASLVGLALVALCLVLRTGRRRNDLDAIAAAQSAPRLAWPWDNADRPSLVLAVVGTVVAMVIAGPAIVLLCAPLLALAWWKPKLRALLAFAPAAALLVCAGYMAYVQHSAYWPHTIQWTSHFGDANTLGWIAVTLLLVDVAAFGGLLTSRPALAVIAPDAPTDVAPGTLGPPRRGRFTLPSLPGRPAREPRPPKDRPTGAQSRLARLTPPRWHGPLAVLVPSRFGAVDEPPDIAGTIISLPGSGISRSVALLRAFQKEQTDPDLFYRTLALDTLHRLTGATPLFNRTVVDVGGGPGYFGEAFRTAGARVILVEPEAADPLPERLDLPDELLDERERHERAVWPGRLLEGDTIAGDGLALPLPDDTFDLVFSSNVLEHVPDPRRFLDEAVRVTRPGGLVYVSFTVWHSPWGGHETSPWHLVSGRYALERYTKRSGHPPKNIYGTSMFPVGVGQVLKLLRQRHDVDVVALEPRYYPSWARFIVRVPIVRELVTWNLVVLLEKL